MSRITFAGFSKDTSTLPDGLFYKCLVWNVGDKIIGPYFFSRKTKQSRPGCKGCFFKFGVEVGVGESIANTPLV
jgi:hypothetical protein